MLLQQEPPAFRRGECSAWINLQHAVYLLLTLLPLTIALPLIYLRVRRLTPLIVGHWLMDLASMLFMLQVG